MKSKHYASETEVVSPDELTNAEVSYRAALEGIVLLANDGALPVAPGRVALYGAGAELTIKGGTGSGEVNERHAVSIREGLEQAGFEVTTEPWLADYRAEYDAGEQAYGEAFRRQVTLFSLPRINQIIVESGSYRQPPGRPITAEDIRASDTDTCFYVIARQSGEGADRTLDDGDYHLSETERQAIATCARNYERFILVINAGSPIDLSVLDTVEGVDAVVYYCQQGSQGGRALADLVSGRAGFSGRLAATWPRRYDDLPGALDYSHLNSDTTEEYYKEGIFVGYRFFDSFGVEPRYAFGHGLSYTEFGLVPGQPSLDGTTVSLPVTVTNRGAAAGQEVVQVYLSAPTGELGKEYQALAGFAKTAVLDPGDSQELRLSFDLTHHASYRTADAAMVLEAGEHILRVGTSSRQTTVGAVVDLAETVVVSRHRHICPPVKPIAEITAPAMTVPSVDTPTATAPAMTDPGVTPPSVADPAPIVPPRDGTPALATIPRLRLDPAAVTTRTYDYQAAEPGPSPQVTALLDRLAVTDLAALTVGAGLAMMGGETPYSDAPGCAGHTTSRLLNRGIPNITLADGPAGVRLQRLSVLLPDGRIRPTDPVIQQMKYLPGWMLRYMVAQPDQGRPLYQYATSIPVGTALAQTWNLPLVEEVGRMVSREMSRYGVTVWLAPALNIQRNPLCGRNFEYFSEDPLISGAMAAALSRGVQATPGNCVAMKHFCCNNQEANRMHTSANLSERTLREIYLRAFEIAVRDGAPATIMSSYNQVNGTYVNNSPDLIMRHEWGFTGFVMTDWMATGPGVGADDLAIAVGNDLIMPGGRGSLKRVLRGLRAGRLTPADLRRSAGRILTVILASAIQREYASEGEVD